PGFDAPTGPSFDELFDSGAGLGTCWAAISALAARIKRTRVDGSGKIMTGFPRVERKALLIVGKNRTDFNLTVVSGRHSLYNPSKIVKYFHRPLEGRFMSKRFSRPVSLRHYVSEVLENAAYEKGEKLEVIVAEAPDLPGCLTQGASFEEARENLVDAIE